MGHWQEAESFLARALSLYRNFPADELRTFNLALTLQDLANTLRPMGRLEEAATLQLEALELLRQIGNLAQLAYCLNNVGYDRYVSGDYEGALVTYTEALIRRKRWRIFACKPWSLTAAALPHRASLSAPETHARVSYNGFR
jgi:tetratricopeptide (TPR) repeat protein